MEKHFYFGNDLNRGNIFYATTTRGRRLAIDRAYRDYGVRYIPLKVRELASCQMAHATKVKD